MSTESPMRWDEEHPVGQQMVREHGNEGLTWKVAQTDQRFVNVFKDGKAIPGGNSKPGVPASPREFHPETIVPL